jgi:hypothetical protein
MNLKKNLITILKKVVNLFLVTFFVRLDGLDGLDGLDSFMGSIGF